MAYALVPWSWQTVGEYLDAVDLGLDVNMLALVGHNPLRLEAVAGQMMVLDHGKHTDALHGRRLRAARMKARFCRRSGNGYSSRARGWRCQSTRY